MRVIANGEAYECARAVRGEDFITLYDEGGSTVGFSGISDFSGYAVEDGEWSDPQPDAMAFLTGLMEEYTDE